MTSKQTKEKTPEAEQLKDTDLDKVQGGFSWGMSQAANVKDDPNKPLGDDLGARTGGKGISPDADDRPTEEIAGKK